jgi:hypothetical protein
MQIQFVGETNTELLELSGLQFEKLKKYAFNFVYEEKIRNFLNSKNYTPLTFKHNGYDMLVNMFLSLDPQHLSNFVNFIENKEVMLYDNRRGNIIQKCVENGLSEAFATKLLNTTAIDQKGNAIGPGEILFSLFFSDLKNSDTDSDLLFNDVNIEVKCRHARFGDRPSKSNQMSISEFIHKLFDVNSIETYERQYGDLKNVCIHLKNGYESHYNKFEYYLTVCDTLDDIYGRGNKISKLFLQEEDIISNQLKNKIAKIYIYGKILSKNIAHILFINDNNEYMFAERYDVLKDNGLIDINVLNIGEFKFNDLYPKVTLNNVDAIVQ